MLSRRRFLQYGAASVSGVGIGVPGCVATLASPTSIDVNDVHSALNLTHVAQIRTPRSPSDLASIIHLARKQGSAISVCGGRHAMGGQQFATDSILVDLSKLNQFLEFDPERGQIEVGAGMQWPELMNSLEIAQTDTLGRWSITQKQTGADRLSLGGAVAANIHGRGLRLKPFVSDIESLSVMTPSGELVPCSRDENAELFSLVAGGYGLFGVVTSVRLRLTPRHKVRRVVELIDVRDAQEAFEKRLAGGFEYGDLQYSPAMTSDDGPWPAVFSCYEPVADDTPMPDTRRRLSEHDWERLYVLAHEDPARAFQTYASHYRSTSGQIYHSDTHQRSRYLDDYHAIVDRATSATHRGSEMISEIYVPRNRLVEFMLTVRRDFVARSDHAIYGTIRLIERDTETFLPWAREPWACVIFNVHVDHHEAGIARAQQQFRHLIERGLEFDGTYYLTYHRWATRDQVERAHPKFVDFLRMKRRFDPDETLQSTWYRHYRTMFASSLDE